MAKKKGDKYKCEECGLVVVVENPLWMFSMRFDMLRGPDERS